MTSSVTRWWARPRSVASVAPRDIALGALWLASPAGSWVTGKVVEIDGGIDASNLDLNIPDLAP